MESGAGRGGWRCAWNDPGVIKADTFELDDTRSAPSSTAPARARAAQSLAGGGPPESASGWTAVRRAARPTRPAAGRVPVHGRTTRAPRYRHCAGFIDWPELSGADALSRAPGSTRLRGASVVGHRAAAAHVPAAWLYLCVAQRCANDETNQSRNRVARRRPGHNPPAALRSPMQEGAP